MLDISYTISPRLKEYLDKIEKTRRQILLTPVSPKTELRLKWEATFDRIYCTLYLAENSINRKDMLKLLSNNTKKKTTKEQYGIIAYKKALDHLYQNWLGSSNSINAQAVIDLHKIIATGQMRVPKAGLQFLLDYLQTRSENPIIKAAVINIEMEKMKLFSTHNTEIAHLASLLFLYKYGYDFKGFLAYEKEWEKERKAYDENHSRALTAPSLTLWLEYFAGSMLNEAENVLQSLEKPRNASLELQESFWKLNERQKSILGFLDQPQSAIANRQVQKRCKTTQVTASRDLAKLTNLGFLFSHGKGRSVYYTKI